MSILRMSEAEVQAHQKRVAGQRIETPTIRAPYEEAYNRIQSASLGALNARIDAATWSPVPKEAKKSRVDNRGGMNGLETEFAQRLEYRKHAGEIIWYAFEPFRIRLANGCFYRPDFAVVDKAGRTTMYECKGQMREAARIRLRVATEKLPYEFYIVRKVKGELRVSIV